MATGCKSLRPAPEKKAATVIGAVLRVNSGWPKISAVCTPQAGIMTAYQRGGSDRGAQGAEGAGGESLDGREGGARWKPKPLSLPEWAVDPAFAAAKLSS